MAGNELWEQKVVGDFIIVNQPLGEGNQGIVYKAFNIQKQEYGDQPLAAKIIVKKKIPAYNDPKKEQEKIQIKNRLKNEVKIQRQYRNEYIVELYYVKETPNNIYLFMELCEGGDLQKVLDEKKGVGIGEELALKYFRQICTAFKMLSAQNVCHRDLKPANLLLKNGNIKIADFGFSRIFQLDQNENQITNVGTPMYMSPQNLLGGNYSPFKQDVYSMGLILYQMIYGVLPFTGKTTAELFENIKLQNIEFDEKFNVSEDVKELIRNMIKYEESERYDWNQVLESPVMKDKI